MLCILLVFVLLLLSCDAISLPQVVIDTPIPGSVRYNGIFSAQYRVLDLQAHGVSAVNVTVHVNNVLLQQMELQENVTAKVEYKVAPGRYDLMVRIVGSPAFHRVTFFSEHFQQNWHPTEMEKNKYHHSTVFSNLFEAIMPKFEPLIDFGCQGRYYISYFDSGKAPLVRRSMNKECRVVASKSPPYLDEQVFEEEGGLLGSTISFCLQADCEKDLDEDGVILRLKNLFSVTSRRCLLIWPSNHMNPALSTDKLMQHIKNLGMYVHQQATDVTRRDSPETYLAPYLFVLDSGPAASPEHVHYTGPDVVIITSTDEQTITSPFTLEISALNIHEVSASVEIFFNNTLVKTVAVQGPVEEHDVAIENMTADVGLLTIRAELVFGSRRIRTVSPLLISSSEKIEKNAVAAAAAAVVVESETTTSPPPRTPPEALVEDFTMGGAIDIQLHYIDETRAPYPIWSREQIDTMIQQVQFRQLLMTNYRYTDLHLTEALDQYWSMVKDKDVLIVGSATPWYECVVIAHGGRPVTVEYNKLRYQHPKMTTYTVQEFSELAEQPTYDVVFSISSLEHDGLGRYGDPIDPVGDLRAMANLSRYLRKDGLLFFAVPVGQDSVVWNAHRVYGRRRLELILRSWVVQAQYGISEEVITATGEALQPLFVLKFKHSDLMLRTQIENLRRTSNDYIIKSEL